MASSFRTEAEQIAAVRAEWAARSNPVYASVKASQSAYYRACAANDWNDDSANAKAYDALQKVTIAAEEVGIYVD